MGMPGAKSALEVKPGLTFLDLTVRQIAALNRAHGVDVPLLLMTSFHTHEDTTRVVRRYADSRVHVTIPPVALPSCAQREHAPVCAERRGRPLQVVPGDLYTALVHSDALDRLLAQGKEYLFVSNSDNLGATVDERILEHMAHTQAYFVMEATDKTRADVQSGALVNYDRHIRLLELAQVPHDHTGDFKSAWNFALFDTSNLWITLRALKRIMDSGGMSLDLIVREKLTDDGQTVCQLETAAGSAIKHFDHALGVHVPRARFIPVKTCGDLRCYRATCTSCAATRSCRTRSASSRRSSSSSSTSTAARCVSRCWDAGVRWECAPDRGGADSLARYTRNTIILVKSDRDASSQRVYVHHLQWRPAWRRACAASSRCPRLR
ncbi:UTP-glucose-1-phosphate uridylyltransferase [Phanerochaete sordida]|uniref:UTP--glucose-1-phosphate uridylyltransferase n=1 Tax=Phanerochaete sordida TaxID=48140 RepID=A0A9P3GHG3_9APHY|nr:UTP-glucose-1-phosphate uridylyltransferase [Phanerochaete sordida]